MTEQEKYGMEQLAEYLDMRIRNEEKNIKENRDKLDRDYLYHFAWNGEWHAASSRAWPRR